MDHAGKIARAASGIRRRVLEHTIRNNGGYLSQACSSAEILASLFLYIMKLNPVDRPLKPKPFPGVPSAANKGYFRGTDFLGESSPKTDRFILSPTHYSLVLYAALIEAGRMDEAGLLDFNKDGSSVEMIGAEHSPGMEVMTGSLGQGLAQAAGIALGRKLKKETGRVWVFMSDGEFQIGQTWETLEFASHYRLDNLGIYIDVNRQQCDGTVESVMAIDSLEKKLDAFGLQALLLDGHDTKALVQASRGKRNGKPLAVICETDPCRGIGLLKSRAPKLHYVRFGKEEEKKQYEEYLATHF